MKAIIESDLEMLANPDTAEPFMRVMANRSSRVPSGDYSVQSHYERLYQQATNIARRESSGERMKALLSLAMTYLLVSKGEFILEDSNV